MDAPPRPTGGERPLRSTGRAGDLIGGRYELTEPIARGGMAEVWEGLDRTLDRAVAVKLLHAHLATDSGFITRFRREAVAAAQLNHPNVVAVFDTGVDRVDDGSLRPFIVMELVRGESLRTRMRAALPVTEAVSIIAQAADGLEYAHRAGLVHRDVKPANVLLRSDGRVQVADFGIAKAVQGADDPPVSGPAGAPQEDLTQAGAILGTAKYLAPEQVEGHALDARTDVYALGVVLYEALTGRPPFAGGNDMATAMAHVRDEATPPRRLRVGIPAPLEAVVLRAMAKRPADRFPSAAAFARALRDIDLRADDARPAVARTAADRTPPYGLQGSDAPAPRSSAPRSAGVDIGIGIGIGAHAAGDATTVAPRSARPPAPDTDATTVAPPTAGRAASRRASGATVAAPDSTRVAAAPPRRGGRATRTAAPALERRTRRRWLAAIAAVSGAILGAGSGWVAQGRVGAAPSARQVAIVRADSFDPFGDGQENDGRLALAVDGDVSTYWSTFLGPRDAHEHGVGLFVTLRDASTVQRIELVTASSRWHATVYVHAGPLQRDGDAQAQLEQWGSAAGSSATAGRGTTRIAVERRRGDRVLVWFDDLGPEKQVIVDELRVFA